jgi:hypothetical protein
MTGEPGQKWSGFSTTGNILATNSADLGGKRSLLGARYPNQRISGITKPELELRLWIRTTVSCARQFAASEMCILNMGKLVKIVDWADITKECKGALFCLPSRHTSRSTP